MNNDLARQIAQAERRGERLLNTESRDRDRVRRRCMQKILARES
jgi:hypothetical protein